LEQLPQEISLLQKDLRAVNRQTRGKRQYLEGVLYGRDVVLVFSRCAKVAAASTVTTLIEVFGVELVVFTGVAGAADSILEIGDVVIGNTLVQHDVARESAESYLYRQFPLDVAPAVLSSFGIKSPKVYEGLIISGDQLVANSETLRSLKMALAHTGLAAPLRVEMEGAAVGQVLRARHPCARHADDFR